ncbi:MAG: hypothetical protein AAF567_17665 [Actinomycetota bacterium]
MTDVLRHQTPLADLDADFARLLGGPKSSVVFDDGVAQLGARRIAFTDAPAWPQLDGLPDDAIIETFLVDDDGGLTALSESPLLDAWRPRAEAMVLRVLASCEEVGLELSPPGYLTCSITPCAMLEGNPHLDDNQFVVENGLGLVAIDGQHVAPRIADGRLAFDTRIASAPVAGGPLPFSEEGLAELGRDTPILGAVRAADDSITAFAQFGQLHAGPHADDVAAVGATGSHRQLMVLRYV